MLGCLSADLPFKIIGIWLALAGAIGFFAMGIDRARADHGEWRISEKTLFEVEAIGGFLGVLLGLWLFHHKTSKFEFLLVVALASVLWILFLSRLGFIGCLTSLNVTEMRFDALL